VVTVGGTSSLTARSLPLCCSASATCRQVLLSNAGAIRHLHHHDRVLIWRPQGLFARAWHDEGERPMSPVLLLSHQDRLRAVALAVFLESAFWSGGTEHHLSSTRRHLILTRDRPPRSFALSLDLILGYAGKHFALGNAAFFASVLYASGLLAQTRSSTSRCWRCWPRGARHAARFRHHFLFCAARPDSASW